MVNLVYYNEAAGRTWTDTGGDETLDLGGLAADAVRQGDQWDRGVDALPEHYRWHLIIDGFDTAPVVGEQVHAYWGSSADGTNNDGDLGAADAASSTVVLPNLHYLGSVTVQTTTAANELVASGTFWLPYRYFTPVIWNATADALLSTSDAHTFTIIPVPPEIQ